MKNQLATEEMSELENIFQGVNQDSLKGWDKTFFSDFHAKFEQYGARTYVSPKQWTHLRRIYEEQTVVPDEPTGRWSDRNPPRDPRDDDEVPF